MKNTAQVRNDELLEKALEKLCIEALLAREADTVIELLHQCAVVSQTVHAIIAHAGYSQKDFLKMCDHQKMS